MSQKTKKPRTINALVLLFLVIVLAGILSYIIKPGAFERMQVDGRTVVVPDSFHYIEAERLSFLDFFRAIPYGVIEASSVVVLILLVGGTIELYNCSGVIDVMISRVVNKYGDKGGPIILTLIIVFFAILGGFLGWIEAAIPFIPLVMPVVIGLGYDALVGVGACVLGCMLGFAMGPTNVLTVGIAHTIAELPMFSGFGFRFLIYIIFILLSIRHVLKYAGITKKDPSKSLMKDIDISDLGYQSNFDNESKLSFKQKLTTLVMVLTLAIVVYGMLKLGWNINDMSAMFIISGILVGFLSNLSANNIAECFMEGARNSAAGAMIVGTARGVQWILAEGQIIDTIIFMLSKPLAHLPGWLSAIGIFIVVTILNFFVPSGSAKAMAMMPILIPLADIIGLTRQTVTLAYQLGDGVSNIFWISYGGLLIFLSYGKVPFDRWLKFLKPLLWKLVLLAFIVLFMATKINYGPF